MTAQHLWIKRLRERLNEETDSYISFQLCWELDQLLVQSQSRLDLLLRNVRPNDGADRVEADPNLLFGRSKQLADLLFSTTEATAADSGDGRFLDFPILEAQRQLSALVENSRDFIGLASMDGQALFVNPAGRHLVGVREDQVNRTVPLDYVAEEDWQLVSTGLAAAQENGNWEGEVRFRNFKTGTLIPMFQQIFEVKDPETGQRIGLGTISRDITKRKRFEESARKPRAKRAHASRILSLGGTTACIAHQVKQPLASIVTNAHACMRMLNAASLDVERLRSTLEEIAGAGERASEAISGLGALLEKFDLDNSGPGTNGT